MLHAEVGTIRVADCVGCMSGRLEIVACMIDKIGLSNGLTTSSVMEFAAPMFKVGRL